MEIIMRPISEVIPYEKNPRNNKAAVDLVANSIKEFGFKNPIIIDADGIVVAGHTRLKAAKKLGLKEVPTIMADDLTPEQIKAFRLADNKTAEAAEWDFDLLTEELDSIFDINMEDFGFDISLEDDAEVIEDDIPDELPEEPKSKLGDIYQLGRHRLMCGDSTILADVEKLMNGTMVDLFLTDPPYNVDYTGKTKDALKIENDKMDDSSFREFLATVFGNAKAVMKSGAAFYIWHADSEGYNFRGAVKDAGFSLRQTLIWKKQSITLGRQDYQWIHEPCLYGWNDGSHSWYSDRKQSTVLEFDRPTVSKIHPTMKPVALFDYQIKNSSKAGDAVLDLFNGSGTTIMACEQNGRNAYCMELDPRYVDAAINRWEEFTGEKAVLLNADMDSDND